MVAFTEGRGTGGQGPVRQGRGAAALRRGAAGIVALALAGLLAGCERELILSGERFDVRAPLEASIPTEANPNPVDTTNLTVNLSAPIALPPAEANAAWTHRAGNARHLAPHGALSAAPSRVWTANIGTGNSRRFRIAAAPVVADGRIFTMDAQSRVAATSLSGQSLWTADLTADFGRGSVISGGGLAAGGGRLFVATGHGELVAVDPASGGILWRQRLGAAVTGAPSVENGVVYVVGRDSSAWAVSAEGGRVLWQLPGVPAAAGMIGSSSPAVTGDAVLFPFSNGDVTATSRDGTPVWASAVAGQRRGQAYNAIRDITGDPVVAGGVTYVGNQAGRTLALDTATGRQIWSADEAAYGPVVVAGGSVFLVSDQARVVRLDAATGQTVWAVEMPYFTRERPRRQKAIHAHYGPVLAGGRIVVASSDGLLRFFSPADGALVGTAPLPGGASASPALAAGLLLVVSGNGQLHAFR